MPFEFLFSSSSESHITHQYQDLKSLSVFDAFSLPWEWHFIKELALQWPCERIMDDADTVNCWEMISWTWKLIFQLDRACRSAAGRYRIIYKIKRGNEASSSTARDNDLRQSKEKHRSKDTIQTQSDRPLQSAAEALKWTLSCSTRPRKRGFIQHTKRKLCNRTRSVKWSVKMCEL